MLGAFQSSTDIRVTMKELRFSTGRGNPATERSDLLHRS